MKTPNKWSTASFTLVFASILLFALNAHAITTHTIMFTQGTGYLSPGITLLESTDEGTLVFTSEPAPGNDFDGDGMPDDWETLYGLDPYDPTDANSDFDADGLTALEEYTYGTDPTNPDTDGDGMTDGEEIANGTGPNHYDPPATQLIVAQASNGGMVAEVNYDGSILQGGLNIYPFGETFMGGITLAKGDINGDGFNEIVVAQASNGGVVKAYDYNRELIFDAEPFGGSYVGGINLACGDIDGDGTDEILVAQASLDGEFKAFKYDGSLSGMEVLSVNPFDEQIGINIAAGDYDGDGEDEIIVAQGYGGHELSVYNYTGYLSFSLVVNFRPFGQKSDGGINVAAGDINGDGDDEMIASEAYDDGVVKIFKYNPSTGRDVLNRYQPFGRNFSKGITLAVGKFSAFDTNDDIAVAQASGGGDVKVHTYSSAFGLNEVFSQAPFGPSYTSGVRLVMGDVNGDYVDEVVAAKIYDGSDVKGYTDNDTPQGEEVFSMAPFDGFTGGVNVVIWN